MFAPAAEPSRTEARLFPRPRSDSSSSMSLYNVAVTDAPVCAYCRRLPVDPAWRPFCSERCKLLDLAKWIDGDYRVPGEPVPADDPDEEPLDDKKE